MIQTRPPRWALPALLFAASLLAALSLFFSIVSPPPLGNHLLLHLISHAALSGLLCVSLVARQHFATAQTTADQADDELLQLRGTFRFWSALAYKERAPMGKAVLVTTAFGVLIEVLQETLTEGRRRFGWDDVLMDSIGAVLGATLAWLAIRAISLKTAGRANDPQNAV
mmetsp:Transcript_24638/g.61542  ORF Transcript_24638/g.61542 Transcript_24638/m.61542 type:complete len:169 (+) Transcript_24638:319-825(+)